MHQLEIFHEKSPFSKTMYRTRHKGVVDSAKQSKKPNAFCLVHMDNKPVI